MGNVPAHPVDPSSYDNQLPSDSDVAMTFDSASVG